VPLPREMEQYLHYFCGDASDPNALAATEPLYQRSRPLTHRSSPTRC
jgi:hypothetical protein